MFKEIFLFELKYRLKRPATYIYFGLMFLMAGLFIALSGMVGDDGTSWPRIGLGAFSFVFGYWCWVGTMKEYERAKAEEKLSRD